MRLIYDVGMHKGEDSDFYLKKGFKVIGFEADPDLAELCRQRFSDELSTGQLILVEGAIVDVTEQQGSDGKIRFFKNQDTSVWGTVVDDWAERNEKLGSTSEIIEVPMIDFSACLTRFGIPYYMKIDIEGMDTVCLNCLKDFSKRPDYVSIESNKESFDKLKEEFALLQELGYDKFQLINQSRITSQKEPKDSMEGSYINYKFKRGASGLFGNDLSKKWISANDSVERYRGIFQGYKLLGDRSFISRLPFGSFMIKVFNRLTSFPGWYDTHAKHSSVN